MNELTPIQPLPLIGLPPLHGHNTSLDRKTDQGRLLAYRAATGRDATLQEMDGQLIDVQDFYSHWVPDTGENAKPGSFRRRIVLIGSDGSLVATSSETAWRCVVCAAAIWEVQPPWIPPLKFKVRLKPRADKKGNFIYLEMVL